MSVPPPRPVHAVEREDSRWMGEALLQAHQAGARGEVPVGAVVIRDGALLGAAGNASVAAHDPTAHAEVGALRAAAGAVGNYRLTGAALYVTVEPCPMCMGAALQARIGRLIYGCADPKAGAAGSVIDLTAHPELNHRLVVTAGIEEASCRTLLQEFFRQRRAFPPA
jgi:tRNA(adenine34) deaminase